MFKLKPSFPEKITLLVRTLIGRDMILMSLLMFMGTQNTFQECLEGYTTLIQLLRSLGFWISWSKVCDPTTKVTFLGITIDTESGTLSLENDKVHELCGLIRDFQVKKRASKRQLESLAGKLAWAAHVIPWGRTHLRPVFDLISVLKQPSHKTRLSSLADCLGWWLTWLRLGNNTKLIWDTRQLLEVFTDSSARAGGGFCPVNGDWFFSDWICDNNWLLNEHINVKELASLCIAALRWSHAWSGHQVIVYTDSEVVEGMVNKGTTSNSLCSHMLKLLSTAALQYNFTVTAVHIPGVDNVIADSISSFHELGQIQRFVIELSSTYNMLNNVQLDFAHHMSANALLSILCQIHRLWRSPDNSTRK